jgi:hypothetical protein
MSEIPSDWSLAALLLFGAMFTALSAGAAILLAELPVLPDLEMLSSLAQCFKPTSVSEAGAGFLFGIFPARSLNRRRAIWRADRLRQ